MILAPHLERPEDADRVARNVLAALRAPHTVEGTEWSVPASVGVSLYPSDGRDMDRLLGRADTAMYRVKDEGGDGHHLFDAELDGEPLTVAVNVSAAQLADSELVADTRRALAESGLPPERLELEITETMPAHDMERAVHTLGSLRELGVHVALDDFGAGDSSLTYLRLLPLDTLKIDRSCLLGLMGRERDGDGSNETIRALAGLAHSLGLRTVVEGVETEAELAWLEASGCDHAQGILLARPMPANGITEWLEPYMGDHIEAVSVGTGAYVSGVPGPRPSR